MSLKSFGVSLLIGLACGGTATGTDMFAESKLFESFVDPKSGVESYLLKPGLVAYEQQSLYFCTKSMTDDGRFLVFETYDGTNEVDDVEAAGGKRFAVVDFHTDRIIRLPADGSGKHQIPFVDVLKDQLYYVNQQTQTFCRRDLLVDPLHEIVLCPMPKEILDVGRVRGWFTHLTMNQKRTKAFIECRVTVKGTENLPVGQGRKSRRFVGTLDVPTGAWHQWVEPDYPANHAAYHPTDENLAYWGWGGFLKEYGERRKAAQKAHQPFNEPFLSMFLGHPDGTFTRFAPEAVKHATHQAWSEDGTYLYWCSRSPEPGLTGVYALDPKTMRQHQIAPLQAMHAIISADNKYITFDWPQPPAGRGSGWETAFYNCATKKQVFIHSSRPPIADIPHKKYSNLHPDPHPQFVCGGKYIVSTFNTETPRRMTVSITPVVPLIARTAQ